MKKTITTALSRMYEFAFASQKNLLALLLLVVLTASSFAESGATCDSAKTFFANSSDTVNIETQTLQTVYYSFTATDTVVSITITNYIYGKNDRINSVNLYGGDCNNLNLLNGVDREQGDDSIFNVHASKLIIGQTYYVVINKNNGTDEISYEKKLLPSPPIFFILAFPSTTSLCSTGQSSVISVLGFPSGGWYSWTPTAGTVWNGTLLTLTVTPTVTTTYIITYHLLGSTTSTSVTINVGTPPPAFTITGMQSLCGTVGSMIFTYQISPYYGSTYTYIPTVTGGTITSPINALGQFTVNWASYTGGIISINCVNTSSGCNTVSTLNIYPCCPNTQGTSAFPNTFTNTTAGAMLAAVPFFTLPNPSPFYLAVPTSCIPGSQAVVSHTQLSINGNFYVDQNLMIWDCDVKMGAGAKITIRPGFYLEIKESHLSSCNAMWDGIYVDGLCEYVFIGNSVIEDAKNAVVSDNGGMYKLDFNAFNKNYKSLVVEKYSGTMINVPYVSSYEITGNVFSCRDLTGLSSPTPALPAFWPSAGIYTAGAYSSINTLTAYSSGTAVPATTLIPPYSGFKTYEGIELNNNGYTSQIITIGDNSYTPTPYYNCNYFDYLDYGIKNFSSNFNVYCNKFMNINGLFSSVGGMAGTAVYATPKGFGYTLIAGGTSVINTNEPNDFFKCTRGIYTYDYNNYIIRNSFTNTSDKAIWINNAVSALPTTNLVCTNTLTNFGTATTVGVGIYCQEINHCTDTKIRNNGFNPNNLLSTSIWVVNTNPIPNTVVEINDNRTDLGRYAIFATNTRGSAQIDSNIINIGINPTTLAAPLTTTAYYGIRAVTCDNVSIKWNTIMNPIVGGGAPANYYFTRGISFENCPTTYMVHNNLWQMGIGVLGACTCTSSALACNNFVGCGWGFRFGCLPLVGADIGNQIQTFGTFTNVPNGNSWSGTYGANGNIVGRVDPPSIWYWNNIPSIDNPTPYSAINVLIPSTPTSTVNQCVNMLIANGGGNGIKREQLLGKTVRGENTYDAFNDEMQLRDSIYAYRTLKTDTTLLALGTVDDTTYQHYYNTLKNSAIGNFEKVKQIVTDSTAQDTTVALQENYNIATRCSMQENQKIVNTIYLNHLFYDQDTTINTNPENLYSTDEIATLTNIAYQHPALGGDAVYLARTMLFLQITDDDEFQSRMHLISNTNTPLVSLFKLYPNPNNGIMQMNYQLGEKDNGFVNVYNVIGEKVKSYPLLKGETVLNINDGNLENGIYFYQVIINDKIEYSDKIVITK